MSTEEIMKLMDAFRKNGLNDFVLEKDGERISMSKDENGIRRASGAGEKNAGAKNADNVLSAPETASETETAGDNGDRTVTAPMVGTYYAAPSPEKAPYVKVGDTVKKGQPVGVIEAMKLMNEVESGYDGVVEEILVRNESLVEYGQPLVRIRENNG